MIINFRWIARLGDSEVYLRLNDGIGRYWDFENFQWAQSDTLGCRIDLWEIPDSSGLSWYSTVFAPPVGGPYQVEICTYTGSVIGYDITI